MSAGSLTPELRRIVGAMTCESCGHARETHDLDDACAECECRAYSTTDTLGDALHALVALVEACESEHDETCGEDCSTTSKESAIQPPERTDDMNKTFRFVAGVEDGIPVALCLEHDLVTQAPTMEELPESCLDMLRCHVAAPRLEGLNPWTMQPPPDAAVAEFRALPECHEFVVILDLTD